MSKICEFKWRKGPSIWEDGICFKCWMENENYHIKICSCKMFFSIISYIMDPLVYHWKKKQKQEWAQPKISTAISAYKE